MALGLHHFLSLFLLLLRLLLWVAAAMTVV
jgi:hypothetical protein